MDTDAKSTRIGLVDGGFRLAGGEYRRMPTGQQVARYVIEGQEMGRLRIHACAAEDPIPLYQDYVKWCEWRDIPALPANTFAYHLKNMGFPNGIGRTKKKGRRGIMLTG